MESSFQTSFSKSLMTGLFAGMIATVICLVYNIGFRSETNFPLNNIINVSTLIFFVNILFPLIGIVHYWFVRYIKRGEVFFIAVLIALTLYFIVSVRSLHRSDDQVLNIEFHHLLTAMIIIMGVAASIGIPVLFHSKKFEEHVL